MSQEVNIYGEPLILNCTHFPVRSRGLCRRELYKTDWSLLPVGGQRQRKLSCPEEACHVPGNLDPQAVIYYGCEPPGT